MMILYMYHVILETQTVYFTCLFEIYIKIYTSYDAALDTLECDNLDVRRDKLCENFAKKAFKNPKYTNWFCIDDSVPQNMNTRSDAIIIIRYLKPVHTRKQRYERSPIPYMTELLNNVMTK